MMEWIACAPKFGDIIRTKVTFYYHYGIFVDENNIIQFGLPNNVYQPAQDIKVLSADIYTFLNGGELEVAKPEKEEKSTLRKPEEIVRIAQSRIGEDGYDILHNNCEHFVYECAFGEKKSVFLKGVRNELRKKLGKKD